MDWKTKTIPLTRPVEMPDGKIEEIMIREPDVEAIEAIEEMDLPTGAASKKKLKVSQIRRMVEILSDAPDGSVQKMHPEDFQKVAREVTSFLERAGQLGTKSTS